MADFNVGKNFLKPPFLPFWRQTSGPRRVLLQRRTGRSDLGVLLGRLVLRCAPHSSTTHTIHLVRDVFQTTSDMRRWGPRLKPQGCGSILNWKTGTRKQLEVPVRGCFAMAISITILLDLSLSCAQVDFACDNADWFVTGEYVLLVLTYRHHRLRFTSCCDLATYSCTR